MRLIFNVLKLSVCSLPSKIVSGWTCRSIRRAGWPLPPPSSPWSGHITFLGFRTSLLEVWLMTCRDNLKINVRESAEMDQADLELRATIMKVLRGMSHYLDPPSTQPQQLKQRATIMKVPANPPTPLWQKTFELSYSTINHHQQDHNHPKQRNNKQRQTTRSGHLIHD